MSFLRQKKAAPSHQSSIPTWNETPLAPLSKSQAAPLTDAARGLLIGLGCGLIVALLMALGALNGLEGNAFNALFRARGQRPPQTRILMVLVTNDTLVRAGRSPLPRRVYADVVRRLHKAGVKTIVFNWLIEFPSGTPDDAVLARAFQEAGNVVQAVTFDAGSSTPKSSLPARFSLDWRGNPGRHARMVAMPLPELLASAPAVGYLNFHLESSGEWRRIQHVMALRNRMYPSLALAGAAHYLDAKPGDILIERGRIVLRGGDGTTRNIPINRVGETMINWAGNTRYPFFSFNELQDGRIPVPLLKDSIVLIGSIHAGAFTPISTPFSRDNEVQTVLHLQANAIDDIINNHPLREAPPYTAIALLGALTLIGGALMGPRGALGALAWMAFLCSLLIIGAFLALSRANLYIPIAAPLLGGVLTCAVCVGYRQIQQSQELRMVRDQFGAYVGEEVLRQLGNKLPELGGETRDVAVLFCDIRDFTTLSENLRDEPVKLVSLLNAHFEPLVDSLKSHGAFVGNYMGDLIIAIFGAPVENSAPNVNVTRSVLAAIDFVHIIRERNAKWHAAGLPIIEVGIGIHTGLAVVGHVGSTKAIQYTAVGDTVNTCSRVENLTRKYNTPLLVTEEVVKACANQKEVAHLQWEFVDETLVKGRSTPVRLFRCSNLQEIV
ncbi:MAG TPA: adenylate/guanylate cyclase domain-containing protein [Abditibacteriaceae bacterium]|jgi:adenylate cyclase